MEEFRPPNELHIVSWNILLDQTRVNKGLIEPQAKRIHSQIQTIQDLRLSHGVEPDVVGICEAERTKKWQNHGQLMAEAIADTRGYWVSHNHIKRNHEREYIGVFGTQVTNAEILELPSDKKAVITRVGDIAIAMNHFRNQRVGNDRELQSRVLLDYLKDDEQAIIMGDFNALPYEKARRLIHNAGFVSVYKALKLPYPMTQPTEKYRDLFVTAPRVLQRYTSLANIDDIYVRGLTVNDADTFVGDSDHYGLWAKIAA